MTDTAINIIKSIEPRLICFDMFRRRLMKDCSLSGKLNFGHKILTEQNELDQYLYTYGPMISSQWENACKLMSNFRQPSAVIDYGCGQGLAGLLINDFCASVSIGDAKSIYLLEPSQLALARASVVYSKIAKNSKIVEVNKCFDDIEEDDVTIKDNTITLHIFSNSLDIPGYDQFKLLSKTLHVGKHYIIAVSHDRDFNGGTPRVEAVKAALEHPDFAANFTIHASTLVKFQCSNPSQSAAVAWACEFEVVDD